jgi:hypothetical protein
MARGLELELDGDAARRLVHPGLQRIEFFVQCGDDLLHIGLVVLVVRLVAKLANDADRADRIDVRLSAS